MRSALLGPMPGNRERAWTRLATGSGREAILGLRSSRESDQAGDVETLSYTAHFGCRYFFGFAKRAVCGCNDHILKQLDIGGIDRSGIDFDGGESAVALGDDFHSSATAGLFHRARGE